MQTVPSECASYLVLCPDNVLNFSVKEISIINFDITAFDLPIALYKKKSSISFLTQRAPHSLAAF